MSIRSGGVAGVLVIAALMILGSGRPASSVPPDVSKDVNVVNTPTVIVSNTPTVNVGNSPVVTVSGPVQIAPVVPYMTQVIAPFADGGATTSANIPIPPGKRFIVEHVSLDAGVPTGQELFAGLNVDGKLFMLVLHRQMNSGGFDIYTASQPMKLYVNAGTAFSGFANRDSIAGGGGANQIFSLSGYLVDLP